MTASSRVDQSPHILLLDDLPALCATLARFLTRSGMTVIACDNAAQALAVLAGDDPVDVLLTDFAMPDMTGDQLIAAARKLRHGLPVILMTGDPDQAADVMNDHAGTGILRLLSKPVSSKELIETVGVVLR
jgi:DNA-binding NtrC family response regulator